MEKIAASIRIRPVTTKNEKKIGIRKIGERGVLALKTSDQFHYEHVFDSKSSNQEIYQTSIKKMITKAVDGYNGNPNPSNPPSLHFYIWADIFRKDLYNERI